jgi:hypothetical protein
VRHGAGSIAGIARAQLGPGAGRATLAFIWIALVYVIVAFTDITAASFVVGTEELAGTRTDFHPGGAVACSAATRSSSRRSRPGMPAGRRLLARGVRLLLRRAGLPSTDPDGILAPLRLLHRGMEGMSACRRS